MTRSRSARVARRSSGSSRSRPVASLAASKEAKRLLELTTNDEFLRESAAIVQEAQKLGAVIEEEAQWAAEWPGFAERCVRPFIRKWGALPLSDPQFATQDPRRAPALAIQASRWGLIPVFPWTGQQEVLSRAREIQQAIGRNKKGFDSRIVLARWLDTNGVPRSAIAAAVWGRKQGLRRPSTGAAIAALAGDREAKLMNRYLGRALPYPAAMRATYRKARGSEAPAAAQVRVAITRDRAASRKLTRDLVRPGRLDPIAGLLSEILRADFEGNPQLPQLIAELRRTLVR